MRLSKDKREAIKLLIRANLPKANVYLFGSRTRDDLRGGDIDVLVLGDRTLTLREKIGIKTSLFRRFGEQRIDIVSFKKDAPAPFKSFVLKDALPL
jgi:uncharacterized protein